MPWLLEPMDPKIFVCAVITLVVGSLAAIACLNTSVDPYGQYATGNIPPLVQDSRTEKYALFEALDAQPDALILGSSRMMKFEPKYFQQQTGLSAFNFAVNHGRPEDFLAMVRSYWDRYGASPKLVLIGVDVASLNDSVPKDARLSAEPNLYRFVRRDLPWREELDRVYDLFSYQQTSASIRSLQLAAGLRTRKQPEVEYDPDGVIQYVTRQAQMAKGEYDFESALAYNQKEFIAIHRQMKQLSQQRLSYLRQTVHLCKRNRCRVFLIATAFHPRLSATLTEKTNFREIEAMAIAAVQQMANELGAYFVDFGSLDSFAGDETQFVDGIHPLESNTRLMIDTMLPKMNEALYAIQ
jgi:hypothetical protein